MPFGQNDLSSMQLSRTTRRTNQHASRLVVACEPAPANPRRSVSGFTGVRGQSSFDYGLQYHEYTPPPPHPLPCSALPPYCCPLSFSGWKAYEYHTLSRVPSEAYSQSSVSSKKDIIAAASFTLAYGDSSPSKGSRLDLRKHHHIISHHITG